MQIKFIGVPGEKHESISMYGHVFPLGKFVDVSGSFAIGKLKGHPHFEAKQIDATDVDVVEKPVAGSLEEFLGGTVVEIKGKLPNLTDDQLKAVAEGEAAGKARAGVLEAVSAEQEARSKKD